MSGNRLRGTGKSTNGRTERICESSRGIADVPCELDPVAVKPSAGNHSVSIRASNARLREKCGQYVTNETADSVTSEDLYVEVSQFRAKARNIRRTSRVSS